MISEAEVFPVDTEDINTAEEVRIKLTTKTNDQEKVFVGYAKVFGRVNKIE